MREDCFGEMQQKMQGIFKKKMLLMRIMYHWQGTCVNKWGTLGAHFYIHVVQFMCDQIQQNIKAYGGFF